MTRVKVCGITNLDDAVAAQESGADMLGFVFAESPRRVDAAAARDIIKMVSGRVKIAAVFVNEDESVVEGIVGELGRVEFLQFHGDETAEYCGHFKDRKVLKAFRIYNESSLGQIAHFRGIIDFALLDTFSSSAYGGTGEAFDWAIALKAKEYGVPIILSGGLNPENVREAVSKVGPYAVDVSSGVEREPGKKDHLLIKNFISAAKRGRS